MAKKRVNLRKFLERDPVDISNHTSWIEDKWWYVQTLVDACKSFSVCEYDIELDSIDLSVCPWGSLNMRCFIQEILIIEDTDLKYPIIVSPGGWIMDGWHRVVRAILDGKKTIKAVRLSSLPGYDGVKDGK